ncbi:MAG TPA: metal ABC transporter permease [Gemmatimonadaceae bacterium]|nr:metal ABC transporter permease [Gemmatimonadaceae bacterium]
MLDLIVIPLAAGLVILAMNAYLGLHVIRRGVIFVDLAFAQIAAVGSMVALLMGADAGTTTSYLMSFGFTLAGALLFSFTRLEESPVPQEAIIGISYVIASAAVILLASFTAEGAEHIKETLTGSLIWVTWPTVFKLAGVYAAIGIFHFVMRSKMLGVTFKPATVKHFHFWDFIFYLTFGIAITFSVNLAGVLMIFSTLVIPAVIAFLYTHRFGAALAIAWGVGAVALVGGLVVSFVWDITTGPLLVLSFGAVLVLAALVRPLTGIKPERADPVDPERSAAPLAVVVD